MESDTPENIHAAIDKIHAKGKKAGVVLKPKTPAEAALPFLEEVELMLVMTVEPGFGGQKFMADMMPKVAPAARGGSTRRTPPASWRWTAAWPRTRCDTCVDAGANVLVAGSAVYKAADIPAKIKALREG